MAFNDKRYYNRDLSWLRFNHRVLQEAADKRNPLYERIKFLAIFSSNLDEFFEVRISDIRQIKKLDKSIRKKLITKPNKLLKKIKKEVAIQQIEFGEIWKEQIIPELKEEGINLLDCHLFTEEQKSFSRKFFSENILKNLTLNLDDSGRHLFIENEKTYLVSTKDEELIWVNIPDNINRFVVFPEDGGQQQIAFVDDIIKHNIKEFSGTEPYSIKVSRDAELYIENEYSGNLLEKIKNALSNRDTGQVTRALIDENMPSNCIEKIKKELDINETDIVLGGAYHNLKDFFAFPNPTEKELTFEALPPKEQKDLVCSGCIFDAIKKKDRLLHFPYESFEGVIHLVESAANDSKVKKIKITLYRVSKDSAVAHALLKALQNGIDVTVFIETKARFDEANNIKWGKILEENKATVIYSYPGIKVHSKILYIEREEEEGNVAYGYIGTGNFNEKTSKIYTDFGLMTAHKKITRELLQIFQVLEKKLIVPKVKHLLVSPFSTRNTFSALIEKEIENAKSGKDAYVILKLNSLQDPQMIDLLYKANNAGVKIRLLIRGICCLIPGIEGQSEHIVVTSIVDRFLEHARVYIFANGGDEKMFMGSADWMTRNLDHRIEVITPVYDVDLYHKMRSVLQLQLDDNVKARIIDIKQNNNYVSMEEGESAQHLTYRLL